MKPPVPQEGKPRSRLLSHVVRRGIPLLVLLGVTVGAYLFWRNFDSRPKHEAAPISQDPISVSVVTIEPETAPIQMRFLGQTEAAQRVEIRARVAGYLQPRLFTEGARVEEGEKLFQIDPRPFEVELAQARAGLESAQARLQRARQQLKRLESLAARQAVSDDDLEEGQTQERVAAAEVQLKQAEIAAAELQLGYTSIEAPITGMIGRALQDTGSYVDAGQNSLLAVILQIDPIYVRYSVTEQDILRFQRQVATGRISAPDVKDVELEITLSDGSTYPHRGRINFLDVQVDVTTGTSVVRGQVPNPDGRLKPGQFIYASVLGIERVDVVRVPQSAVTQSPTGASVFVVNEKNVVEVRPVVLGEWSGTEHWIVEQGLEPGDRVVTDRLMMVRPGMSVVVADRAASDGQEADGRGPADSGRLPATASGN